jgi:hypothetical protein
MFSFLFFLVFFPGEFDLDSVSSFGSTSLLGILSCNSGVEGFYFVGSD